MKVDVAKYPQLKLLCWNRKTAKQIDGADALALYESNWRHIDQNTLTADEKQLIGILVDRYGAGVLNVQAAMASEHCKGSVRVGT